MHKDKGTGDRNSWLFLVERRRGVFSVTGGIMSECLNSTDGLASEML